MVYSWKLLKLRLLQYPRSRIGRRKEEEEEEVEILSRFGKLGFGRTGLPFGISLSFEV